MLFIKIISCCLMFSFIMSSNESIPGAKEKVSAIYEAYDIASMLRADRKEVRWNEPSEYVLDGHVYRLVNKSRAKRVFVCEEIRDRHEFFFYHKSRTMSDALKDEVYRHVESTAMCNLSVKEVIPTFRIVDDGDYVLVGGYGDVILIAEGISIEVYTTKNKKVVKEIAKAIFEAGLVK